MYLKPFKRHIFINYYSIFRYVREKKKKKYGYCRNLLGLKAYLKDVRKAINYSWYTKIVQEHEFYTATFYYIPFYKIEIRNYARRDQSNTNI